MKTNNEFFIALFDVLGFEDQLGTLGLQGMLEKYEALVRIVDSKNEEHKEYKEANLHGAFWLMMEDGPGTVHPVVLHEIGGAYASDSIIVWASRRLLGTPICVNAEPGTITDQSTIQSPYVFADSFLEVCCELICHSIEIGLPLRGGLSTGEAILEKGRGIYLGQPIIDTARIEGAHKFIGASFHQNFSGIAKNEKYLIPYAKDIKNDADELRNGICLDWPRHWKETRDTDLINAVHKLNNNQDHSEYYDNTLEFISESRNSQRKIKMVDYNFIFPELHAKYLHLPARRGRNTL